MRESADAVLDLDHGIVDSQPEVDRTQTHQATDNPGPGHQVEGKQHRKRNGRGDNQTGPEIAEEEKQDGDHEGGGEQQVVFHRFQHGVHQIAPVIHRLDFDAGRQTWLDLLELSGQTLRHIVRILAGDEETDAEDGLAGAAIGGTATPDFVPDHDIGDVADTDRDAVTSVDDQFFDFGAPGDGPDAANDSLLAATDHLTAGDIRSPLLDGLDDRRYTEPILHEAVGVHHDLILFFEPSPAVHFGHPGYGLQLRLDDPVLYGAELGRILGFADDDILKNLAETGRYRPELRGRDAIGQFNTGQPFGDLLSAQIDVDLVVEHQRQLREAELGQGTKFCQPRKTGELTLDRESDLALNLFGRPAGSGGVDLHRHRGGIGEGIERQINERDDAENAEHQSQTEDDGSALDGEINKSLHQRRLTVLRPRRSIRRRGFLF